MEARGEGRRGGRSACYVAAAWVASSFAKPPPFFFILLCSCCAPASRRLISLSLPPTKKKTNNPPRLGSFHSTTHVTCRSGVGPRCLPCKGVGRGGGGGGWAGNEEGGRRVRPPLAPPLLLLSPPWGACWPLHQSGAGRGQCRTVKRRGDRPPTLPCVVYEHGTASTVLPGPSPPLRKTALTTGRGQVRCCWYAAPLLP